MLPAGRPNLARVSYTIYKLGQAYSETRYTNKGIDIFSFILHIYSVIRREFTVSRTRLRAYTVNYRIYTTCRKESCRTHLHTFWLLIAILCSSVRNINVIREHPPITRLFRAWIRILCCCLVRITESVLRLECSKSYEREAWLGSLHISVASYDLLK